ERAGLQAALKQEELRLGGRGVGHDSGRQGPSHRRRLLFIVACTQERFQACDDRQAEEEPTNMRAERGAAALLAQAVIQHRRTETDTPCCLTSEGCWHERTSRSGR